MGRRYVNAYIDESGDDGFARLGEHGPGASSEWLILAAVLMFEEEDRVRTEAVDRLRQELGKPPPTPLHWRKLRKQSQKRRAVGILAAEPLHFCVVALWKPPFVSEASPGLRKKGYLYNYAARFLIERLSWYANNGNRGLNLLFESRATTSYTDLAQYIQTIQGDPDCSIPPGTIADVRPVPSALKGAQLADHYAGAAQDALGLDKHGMSSSEYLWALRHQLFRQPGRSVLKDGFKVFPDKALDEKRYPWLGGL
jgi:hypothetical protein